MGQLPLTIAEDSGLTFGENFINANANFDELYAADVTLSESVGTLTSNLNSLVTLSGMVAGNTHLSTFTGVTIPDNRTIKQALQALETALEDIDTSSSFDPAAPGEIGATTPAKGNFTEIETPFSDGSAGVIWPQVNTSFTPVAGSFGIIPYNGNLYTVVNGVISSLPIGSGGSDGPTIQAAPPVVGDTNGYYIAPVAGAGSKHYWKDTLGYYNLTDGGYTAFATYSLTLSVLDEGTITINSTDYTSVGSPHTITGLSGVTAITAAYGGSNDTFEWSGTDFGDITGDYPTYSITMDEAKSITGTFSEAAAAGITDNFDTNTTNNYTAIRENQGLVVTGGHAEAEGSIWSDANYAYHNDTLGSPNQSVTLNITTSGSSGRSGIIIRCNGAGLSSTGYVISHGGDASTMGLSSFASPTGAPTFVGTFFLSEAWVDGESHDVRVTVNSSNEFNLYIDWTDTGTFVHENSATAITDSTYTTGNYIGLYFYLNGSTTAFSDNLEAEAL